MNNYLYIYMLPTDRSVGRSIVRAVCRVIGRSVGRSGDRSVGRTVGWSGGRSVGRVVVYIHICILAPLYILEGSL